MKRKMQGHYVIISTAGEKVKFIGTRPPATINKTLAHLEHLGILRKITGRKRNRLFAYERFVDVLNR